MKLILIHGGQTGVDRGAHWAALETFTPIAGWMPNDECDELGNIPVEVKRHLKPCPIKGYAARTARNIDLEADALIAIVPDRHDPWATPGTKKTLELARKRGVPRLACDPTSRPISDLAGWVREQQLVFLRSPVRSQRSDFRLMIAGPRASKWPQGETTTVALLRDMLLELRNP